MKYKRMLTVKKKKKRHLCDGGGDEEARRQHAHHRGDREHGLDSVGEELVRHHPDHNGRQHNLHTANGEQAVVADRDFYASDYIAPRQSISMRGPVHTQQYTLTITTTTTTIASTITATATASSTTTANNKRRETGGAHRGDTCNGPPTVRCLCQRVLENYSRRTADFHRQPFVRVPRQSSCLKRTNTGECRRRCTQRPKPALLNPMSLTHTLVPDTWYQIRYRSGGG